MIRMFVKKGITGKILICIIQHFVSMKRVTLFSIQLSHRYCGSPSATINLTPQKMHRFCSSNIIKDTPPEVLYGTSMHYL